jgi:superfamily II DNA or RNA helicase
MRAVPPWPTDYLMRDWQEAAYSRLLRHDADDFMLVATPGAGKTTFALRVAHSMLSAGRVLRVVVVCPTEHLKRQWAQVAARFGINLDAGWKNDHGFETADMHGAAVTYAQVSRNPTVHRRLCAASTLAIFDEVHHAGKELSWGDGLREAFAPARFRLLLSGTPFRSDANPIPFVDYTYDEAGVLRSRADYAYDYGAALGDATVCRPILFPSFEGRVQWELHGELYSGALGEDVGREDEARRLRNALDSSGDWLRSVLRDAHRQLLEVRNNGHPNAGGLVIAVDQEHARAVGLLLQSVSGAPPVLAISDEPEPSDAIEDFRKGTAPWIVAVRMVSEGVDIPRLRVGVYATNVLTELFFRQAVGRLVRWVEGLEEQSAYMYIPAVPTLVGYAERIKEERDHQLREERDQVLRELEEEQRTRESGQPLVREQFVGAGEGELDQVITDSGVGIAREELERARRIGVQCGFGDTAWQVRLALALRLAAAEGAAASTAPEPPPFVAGAPAEPVYILRKRLRTVLHRRVAQLSARSHTEYTELNRRLHERDGTWTKDATIDQLKKRIALVEQWLEESDGNSRR